MTLRIAVRREAGLEIEESALWYEMRREGLGRQFLDEVEFVFDRMTENPAQFPAIENETRRALVRRFPYGVYFTQDDDLLTVLAVLHLHRHPDSWRQRR